jgi:hypothetical protein
VFLKKGGRIIIFNKPNRGYKNLFSSKGVKSNSELVDFLKKSGFEIEHISGGFESKKGYPAIQNMPEEADILLVAKKKH